VTSGASNAEKAVESRLAKGVWIWYGALPLRLESALATKPRLLLALVAA